MTQREMKHDALGTVRLVERDGVSLVERDTRTARFGVRWLARRLAAREARMLQALDGIAGVPRLHWFDGALLHRSHLAGSALHLGPRPTPRYFARALAVLRSLHRSGIAHNDLAKEANWIHTAGGGAGIVDYQIAFHSKRRSCWFRVLAREDLRHWLKHKRTYCPERLTARQRALLAAPALPSSLWRLLWKPIYRAVTRHALGWRDRDGPAERDF